MAQGENEALDVLSKHQEKTARVLEKLVSVADASTVFSKPVTVGDYTVVTASEVSVAMGFGFGAGGGAEPTSETEDESQPASGVGGGGGGGGVSSGRPVAVIIVGPSGVLVEPVLDRTKIALTVLTAVGGFLLMMAKMGRVFRR